MKTKKINMKKRRKNSDHASTYLAHSHVHSLLKMALQSKIRPFLWFNDKAEDAAKFYTSIFPDSEIVSVNGYPMTDTSRDTQMTSKVMTVDFKLSGQKMVGLNGGSHVQFNEAISFVIDCKDQAEVDYYWNKLTSDGGKEKQCGWCADRFGVVWQVVPVQMIELLTSKDQDGATRATEAMMKMKKLDIAAMRAAFENAKNE